MFIAQGYPPALTPEGTVALLALLLMGGFAVWLFVRWLLRAPVGPDPWDRETAESLEGPESRPLCHRCLAPQELESDFCRECGAPVGQYTNLMPFPYLFSIGHELRIGTSGQFRRSPLTVIGFPLLALAIEPLVGLIYCVVFLIRLGRPVPPSVAAASPAGR